jgi:hypothetical protein
MDDLSPDTQTRIKRLGKAAEIAIQKHTNTELRNENLAKRRRGNEGQRASSKEKRS